MEYELTVLEHLITVVLNPSIIRRQSLTDKFLSDCIRQAHAERDRISKQLRVIAFGERHKSDLASYYRKHQAILVQLSDTIYNYLQPAGLHSIYRLTNKVSIINFYRQLALVPQLLLDFIEINNAEYFSPDIKLPEAKRSLLAPQIKKDLKHIRKRFLDCGVDKALIQICCQPIEDCLLPEEAVSGRRMQYIQAMQRELILLTKQQDCQNMNDQLCRSLLNINYNSPRFFNYFIMQLQQKAKACDTLAELIEYYSLSLKINNQFTMRTELVYNTTLPSIKEQVGTWICEELYYLERQNKLLNHGLLPNTEEPSYEMKIHTSLSVSHLALAVKILVESKIITNANTTELMRAVARNFRTDRQEVISEESLRNKSYNFEAATVNRLKDEIIGLMNLVRGY